MFAVRTVAAGMLAGWVADLLLADPRRGHPVALFGRVAVAVERATYRDARWAGVLHTGLLVSALGAVGFVAQRAAVRWLGAAGLFGLSAAATWAALGGTSLTRTGLAMSDMLSDSDIDGARWLLPSLCGRDPQALDADGLARAALESVAENTSDAQVAPLLWAAVGGVPAVLAYRGINTLDAMIGHRSPRYRRFGWAVARLDDAANLVPARITAALVVLCAPAVGGSPAAAARVWWRDATRHPSPNAGVVEAAFAGALGVRLGGPTQYAHQLEIRPTLGDGRPPLPDDLRRAVVLSRAAQTLGPVVALLVAVMLGAGRWGHRRRP